MKNVSEYFGNLVFDDRVMKATLSAEVYQSLKKTIDGGERLDISVANAVAGAMKDWAVANGATHYTHWFQPLTGITAEKHDSFITCLLYTSSITDMTINDDFSLIHRITNCILCICLYCDDCII